MWILKVYIYCKLQHMRNTDKPWMRNAPLKRYILFLYLIFFFFFFKKICFVKIIII